MCACEFISRNTIITCNVDIFYVDKYGVNCYDNDIIYRVHYIICGVISK